MRNYRDRMLEGADIIIEDWMQLNKRDNLLIVTEKEHELEADLLKESGLKITNIVDIMIVTNTGMQVGIYFDENEKVFDKYNAIIGATDYSIVTTKAAKRAIDRGGKFLSLPLSVRTDESILSYDFIRMNTEKSKLMAGIIMSYIEDAGMIKVKTDSGTNLNLYKEGRRSGFFNGVVDDGDGYSSSSFEIYVPIEEDRTEGIMIVDGSLGYIGKPKDPIKLIFRNGRIVDIEDNESGHILREYIESYNDDRMYNASELGIGLNSYSRCRGKCYIEDESAYGTYHIGFGRNIALGGVHEASGHFDLVGLRPNVYADNRKIMERGRIIVPKPDFIT